MKVNLECGTNIRNGYININSSPIDTKLLDENTKFAIGHFKNLDPIIADNTVDELIFNPPMNAIYPQDILPFLDHVYKKVKKDGIFKFSFIDIRRASKGIYSGDLGMQDAHNLLYGPNYVFKSIVDLPVIENAAKHIGFKVDMVYSDNYFIVLDLRK